MDRGPQDIQANYPKAPCAHVVCTWAKLGPALKWFLQRYMQAYMHTIYGLRAGRILIVRTQGKLPLRSFDSFPKVPKMRAIPTSGSKV